MCNIKRFFFFLRNDTPECSWGIFVKNSLFEVSDMIMDCDTTIVQGWSTQITCPVSFASAAKSAMEHTASCK
jgi:hypothetical protein